jgi:hypothetical protein
MPKLNQTEIGEITTKWFMSLRSPTEDEKIILCSERSIYHPYLNPFPVKGKEVDAR